MEVRFKEVSKNIGTLVEGGVMTVDFPLKEDFGGITHVLPRCSCTQVMKADEAGVTLKYTAPKIPKHLKSVGETSGTQFVKVTFSDEHQVVLSFDVKIKKR